MEKNNFIWIWKSHWLLCQEQLCAQLAHYPVRMKIHKFLLLLRENYQYSQHMMRYMILIWSQLLIMNGVRVYSLAHANIFCFPFQNMSMHRGVSFLRCFFSILKSHVIYTLKADTSGYHTSNITVIYIAFYLLRLSFIWAHLILSALINEVFSI